MWSHILGWSIPVLAGIWVLLHIADNVTGQDEVPWDLDPANPDYRRNLRRERWRDLELSR